MTLTDPRPLLLARFLPLSIKLHYCYSALQIYFTTVTHLTSSLIFLNRQTSLQYPSQQLVYRYFLLAKVTFHTLLQAFHRRQLENTKCTNFHHLLVNLLVHCANLFREYVLVIAWCRVQYALVQYIENKNNEKNISHIARCRHAIIGLSHGT